MAWRDRPDPDPIATEPRRRLVSTRISAYMQGIAADVADCIRVLGWHLDPHGVTASGFLGELDRGLASGDRELARAAERQPGPDRRLDPARQPGHLRAGPARRQAAADPDRRPGNAAALDAEVDSGRQAADRLHAQHHLGGLGQTRRDVRHQARWSAADRRSGSLPRPGGRDSANHTLDRLRAATELGIVEKTEARVLEEAFELFTAMRLEHQVAQIEEGHEPDDHIDPRDLDPLTRRYLRDAFREVEAVQRSRSSELRATRRPG
jgi:hypothetical protein